MSYRGVTKVAGQWGEVKSVCGHAPSGLSSSPFLGEGSAIPTGKRYWQGTFFVLRAPLELPGVTPGPTWGPDVWCSWGCGNVTFVLAALRLPSCPKGAVPGSCLALAKQNTPPPASLGYHWVSAFLHSLQWKFLQACLLSIVHGEKFLTWWCWTSPLGLDGTEPRIVFGWEASKGV